MTDDAQDPTAGSEEPSESEGTPETVGDHVDEPSAAAGDAPKKPQAGADSEGLLYGIDDIPPTGETIALGFQHYLTMFGSTVAIPLILAPAFGIDPSTAEGGVHLAKLMATMFFISGITTLLQTTWGNRLPIVQGGTFSFLGPTFAICGMAALVNEGWEVRITHVQGAVILGAIVEIAMGLTGLAGRTLKYVGPITIAPTIALIGLALFKFGAPNAGKDWWIGGLTIVLIILFSQILRKTHRAFELYPILLALLLAWGVAALLTALGVFQGPLLNEAGDIVQAAHPSYVSMDNVRNAPWVRIPYPFQWGMPQFGLAAFVGMLAGYVASMVESIGDYFACARLSGAPTPDAKTVNRGITFEGIGCLIAGIFGTGNGTTSYSENIGAIGLTRVGSRRVVQAGAVIMLLLGTVGKFGALFTTIPAPVVGGMYCALFGMIAAVGLSSLQFVNLNSSRNLFILGFAFFMGLSLPVYFEAHPVSIMWGAPDAASATVLAETDTVQPDAGALATLGLDTSATVAQAKQARDTLKAAYADIESLGAVAAARRVALDAAFAAVSVKPPPPPTMIPLNTEETVRPDAAGLKRLGITNKATVAEAQAARDALAKAYEESPLLASVAPGETAALDVALAAVSVKPAPTEDAPYQWLARIINTLGVNGMAIAAFLAFVLDNIVPGTPEERGILAMSKHGT